MNRKILAGALALTLPLAGVALVGVEAAGAKTPAISSVVIKNASSATVTNISPYQTYSITINGTNLPTDVSTSSTAAHQILGSITGHGLYGLLGSALTVNSITSDSATQIKASVEGPTGNSVFYLQGGSFPGYNAGDLTISLTKAAATSKKPAKIASSKDLGAGSVTSNCGSTLPTAATAGTTYGLDSNGNLDLSNVTGSDNVAYFDVVINALIAKGNLCSDDIGTATTSGSPEYNSNYPVTFTSGGSLVNNYSVKNVAFSFPYSANNTLSVYGEQEQFQLKPATGSYSGSGAVCGGFGATQPSGVTVQSCTVSNTGLVTLVATGVTTYTKGDTISSPTFSVLGLNAAYHVVPVSTTSEIGLYTPPASGTPHPGSCTYSSSTNTWTTVQGSNGVQVCTSIIFAPRVGSGNDTYSVATAS